MMRSTFRLVALAALALVVPLHAAAQDGVGAGAVAAAPKPEIRNSTPEELREKARYTPSEFEMTVNPPVDAGDGVSVESLRYPSPVNSEDTERNDVVRARLFHTAEPEPAAVIALGGWRFDPLTPELSRQIAIGGIQVLWIEIPYQGQRTPKGSRPGEMTLSSDLARNEQVFIQLAQDVARAVDWLVRERGIDRSKVGLLGTSLGGFAAATLYGMQDYKAVTAQLAGDDVAKVLFNGNWLTARLRADLDAKGLEEDVVRERLKGMSPGTWADPKRKDGVLLVAAELDEIVPLDSVKALRKAYGGPEMIVMAGEEHRAAEGMKKALPQVRAHFEKVLLGREPKPESSTR